MRKSAFKFVYFELQVPVVYTRLLHDVTIYIVLYLTFCIDPTTLKIRTYLPGKQVLHCLFNLKAYVRGYVARRVSSTKLFSVLSPHRRRLRCVNLIYDLSDSGIERKFT